MDSVTCSFLKESNAIEGVYDDDSLKQAEYAWEFLETQLELSPQIILKTHKILMLHQPLLPDEKGYFRKIPVWVGGREGEPYSAIPSLISQWCVNANDVVINGKNEPREFIENLIKEHHIKYEQIHPFVDGNGRTGRMFLNWQRIKSGLEPMIILEKEKHKYYEWFN